MQKEEMWSRDADRTRAAKQNRDYTTAFYIATHAASVHACLALMAPDDKHHFAIIKGSYGYIANWDVKESAKLRLTPRTQVAGAAMVTDAVEVVKMLVSEGLSPILTNSAAIPNLWRQYQRVRDEGMRCAVYASWFFNGHPEPETVTKIEFNQKEASTAALIGELGTVATKFYRGTTIGESPALANASSQMAIAADQTKWAQLARFKTGAVSETVIRAYGRLSGAMAGDVVDGIASDDEARVRGAIATYTTHLAAHAAQYGVTVFTPPDADRVVAGSASADARAAEIVKATV